MFQYLPPVVKPILSTSSNCSTLNILCFSVFLLRRREACFKFLSLIHCNSWGPMCRVFFVSFAEMPSNDCSTEFITSSAAFIMECWDEGVELTKYKQQSYISSSWRDSSELFDFVDLIVANVSSLSLLSSVKPLMTTTTNCRKKPKTPITVFGCWSAIRISKKNIRLVMWMDYCWNCRDCLTQHFVKGIFSHQRLVASILN